MKAKKIPVALACACLTVALGGIIGCGGSAGGAGSADSAGGNDVTLSFVASGPNTQSVFTSDPSVDYTGKFNQANGTCETLFVLDDDTKEVEPLLATDIEQPDDTTWVITLRDGVTFSNGKAMDAAAVKAAFEYILESNTRLATLMDVASIEADGQTLTIKTNEVVAIMPRILTEQNMLVFDVDDDNLTDGLVGTGPFVIERMDTDGTADYVRNDDYWQGTPAAARLHTLPINDTTAASNALQSGEIDWATVGNNDLKLFEGDDRYTIQQRNYGRVYYLYLNPNYTFTEDDALREALMYAIDREAIVGGVYGDAGEATRSIFPSTSEFYTDEYLQPAYDVDRARKILADAGYEDSDGDGFVEKGGEKVTLNITCYDANNFTVLSEVVQGMLKEIGIDSSIVVSDTIFDDLTKGDFNIATYGYNTLTLGDSYNYLQPVFETGASSNFTGFSSEQVDADLAEMRATADAGERAELSKDMQRYIYESNERLYIMHTLENTVSLSTVQNLPALYGGDNTNNSVLWEVTK